MAAQKLSKKENRFWSANRESQILITSAHAHRDYREGERVQSAHRDYREGRGCRAQFTWKEELLREQ